MTCASNENILVEGGEQKITLSHPKTSSKKNEIA